MVLCGCSLLFTRPLSVAAAAVKSEPESILDRFLGEGMFFHIGYWLIPHCGEAVTDLVKTDTPNIYRVSLQGRTVGIIDALIGRLRYSYVSYAQFVEKEDRLRPIFFQIITKRAGKDLSSGSGEVELWVTPEIMPISGKIKDVVFFGDLWGDLMLRKFLNPDRIFSIPEHIKNRIPF